MAHQDLTPFLPLEPVPFVLVGRALLTLLEPMDVTQSSTKIERGSVERALALLATPKFAKRPAANSVEVQERFSALRGEWDKQ